MASGWDLNGPLKLSKIASWCPMWSWGPQETALGTQRDALMDPMDAPGLHLGALSDEFWHIWHAFGQYFLTCWKPSHLESILFIVMSLALDLIQQANANTFCLFAC